MRVQLYYLQYVCLLKYMLRTEQSHHDRYISFFRSNLRNTTALKYSKVDRFLWTFPWRAVGKSTSPGQSRGQIFPHWSPPPDSPHHPANGSQVSKIKVQNIPNSRMSTDVLKTVLPWHWGGRNRFLTWAGSPFSHLLCMIMFSSLFTCTLLKRLCPA